MTQLSYVQVLQRNQELGASLTTPRYDVAVLSNMTVDLCKEIVEHMLREQGINAQVRMGSYNNIVQESSKCGGCGVVIIFWEMCNIMEGLSSAADVLTDEELRALIDRVKGEIDLVFRSLANMPLVLINKFSALPFCSENLQTGPYARAAHELSQYLVKRAPANVCVVDIEKVYASIGLERSIDLRNYYASKVLYTTTFFRAYVEHVKPAVLSVNGMAKKALVLDCDNTLWKGILGEDGFNGIEMSPHTKGGAVYRDAQNILLALARRGVLLGLCSKNDLTDVNEVLDHHTDMVLRQEHIVIKKVDWSDKARAILKISEELNIGLDSIVFVDDSSFEVDLVRSQLPQVEVFQVPGKREDYPRLLRKISELFYRPSLTSEDKEKARMYKSNAVRAEDKAKFVDIEGYIASLGINVTLYVNAASQVARISQMCQKTNQFNLTTKRYAEVDIQAFLKDPSLKIIAFSVKDKFGDDGLTGVVIVRVDHGRASAVIDSFLMSCRVIGRNIEYILMRHVVMMLKQEGIKTLKACYERTSKNQQTQCFYDECGFVCVESAAEKKEYILDVECFQGKDIKYIEVSHG